MISSPQLPQSLTRHNNLPAPLTSLVGREDDIAKACALLRQVDVRLLTMTGPGGVGKTRLALRVAGELLDDFEHGVFFVSLASINDPQLVVSRIGQVLDVREFGGQPLLELLKAYLLEKHLLLVLDNYEHVLPAASVVSDLLLACPTLKILVTSRALLHLNGEHEYTVSPLELPELTGDRGRQTETLGSTFSTLVHGASSPAVELFVQRAHAVQRDFGLTNRNERAVAEICIHLDGLPLAIELAAARVKVFKPGAILRRLQGAAEAGRPALLASHARDLPARQQTLEQAIAWSYNLLNQAHQAVFRRLAVFAGGCTLDAAMTVCADLASENVAPVTGESIPDALQTLREFNLLTTASGPGGETRYGMLETIRAYAWQRLRESGEEEIIRRRHAELFLAFAERGEVELHGPDDVASIARLETENDNLRAALHWMLETPGRAEMCLRLVGALREFWYLAGYVREGLDWALGALALPGAQAITIARVKALHAAGLLQGMSGNLATGRQVLEEGCNLARVLVDRRLLAYCLLSLAWLRGSQSDPAGALSLWEESVALFREVGDHYGLARALGRTAQFRLLYSGDTDVALVEESLSLSQALGNRMTYGKTLETAGVIYTMLGDYARARALMEQALAQVRLIGQRALIADVFCNLGELSRSQGDYQSAQKEFEEALALVQELGDWITVTLILHGMGYAALRQADHDIAAGCFRKCSILAAERGIVPALAGCLAGIAGVATAIGEERQAARLLGAEEVLFNRFAAPVDAADRMDYDYIVQTLSTRLDAETLAAAWAEGRTLSQEQAVALALEITEAAQGR
jgi:predicted ATPase